MIRADRWFFRLLGNIAGVPDRQLADWLVDLLEQ